MENPPVQNQPPTAKDIDRLAWYALRLARLNGLQESDRDDLHSDMVVLGLNAMKGYDGSRGTFSTYFLRHAVANVWRAWNKARDWRHINNRVVMLESEVNCPLERCRSHYLAYTDRGSEVVDASDAAERLDEEMLAALTEREHGIFVARVVEGVTLEEIAIRLNITRQRVQQIEKSALKKIRSVVLQIAA